MGSCLYYQATIYRGEEFNVFIDVVDCDRRPVRGLIGMKDIVWHFNGKKKHVTRWRPEGDVKVHKAEVQVHMSAAETSGLKCSTAHYALVLKDFKDGNTIACHGTFLVEEPICLGDN